MVTQFNYKLIAFTAGDQTKMDRSFPSCTTEHVHQQRQNGCFRDGIRSNRVWICCCSLMKSWLIMFFLHKICTRPIGRLVSQFYSSLGCFYPSGTTRRVVSSNTALKVTLLIQGSCYACTQPVRDNVTILCYFSLAGHIHKMILVDTELLVCIHSYTIHNKLLSNDIRAEKLVDI